MSAVATAVALVLDEMACTVESAVTEWTANYMLAPVSHDTDWSCVAL